MTICGCKKEDNKPKEPYVVPIGVILDFNGDKADESEAMYNAIETAVKEINEAGGVLAEGLKLSLIRKDDMGDYMNSVACYYQLVEEGACAVIGTNNPEGMEQLIGVSAGQNVPIITPSVSDNALSDAADFVFQSCFSDKYMTQALIMLAKTDLAVGKVAVIYSEDSTDNTALYEDFAASAMSEGLEIAYAAKVDSTDEAALYDAFERICKSEAQAVFVPITSGEEGTRLLTAAKKTGYEGVFLGTKAYSELSGDTCGYDVYIPRNTVFNEDSTAAAWLTEQFGSEVPDGIRPAYDAVYIIRDAIEKGYLATPVSVALKLPFLEGSTLFGDYSIGAYGGVGKSVDFIKVTDDVSEYAGTVFE